MTGVYSTLSATIGLQTTPPYEWWKVDISTSVTFNSLFFQLEKTRTRDYQ